MAPVGNFNFNAHRVRHSEHSGDILVPTQEVRPLQTHLKNILCYKAWVVRWFAHTPCFLPSILLYTSIILGSAKGRETFLSVRAEGLTNRINRAIMWMSLDAFLSRYNVNLISLFTHETAFTPDPFHSSARLPFRGENRAEKRVAVHFPIGI